MAYALGGSVPTVRQCRNSDTILNGPHRQENLAATLNPVREAIAIELRPHIAGAAR